jgi:hypothetical protein
MNPYPYTVDAFDNSVDKICGKLEFFTRIPTGRKGRSHEGTPFALPRHDHFGQHRLVKLDEVTSGIPQFQ